MKEIKGWRLVLAKYPGRAALVLTLLWNALGYMMGYGLLDFKGALIPIIDFVMRPVFWALLLISGGSAWALSVAVPSSNAFHLLDILKQHVFYDFNWFDLISLPLNLIAFYFISRNLIIELFAWDYKKEK